MTDLTPELGSSVSCPNCGNQVTVPAGGTGAVRCPSCGATVDGGTRDQAEEDLTNDELLRSLATKGYDTDVTVVEPDQLRCEGCGTTTAAEGWLVDDVRRASNMVNAGASESAIVALRCPSCERLGRAELELRGGDASADDRVHAALLDRQVRQERQHRAP